MNMLYSLEFVLIGQDVNFIRCKCSMVVSATQGTQTIGRTGQVAEQLQ